MRALSIRQPWAWAILHAGKRVENRKWSPPFRGGFLIHASKACPRGEYMDAVEWMARRGFVRSPRVELGVMEEIALRVAGVDPTTLPEVPPRDELPLGGIVGRARVLEVLPPSLEPTAPWHVPARYGIVVGEVEPLPFRSLQGMLGFFRVPEELVPWR